MTTTTSSGTRRVGGDRGKGRKRPTYGSKRRVGHNGYVYLYKPEHALAMSDGYVAEHRYVLHEAGVDVPPGYHVHHENRDRQDNRLENLTVLSPDDHRREHGVHERGPCVICGAMRPPKRRLYCSRACRWADVASRTPRGADGRWGAR